MGFDSDAFKIPRPHRQLRRARLGLIFMLMMIAAGEPLAQALIEHTQVPVEWAGSTGGSSIRPAVPAGEGQIIILSSARKQVTINGQTARLGGRLGVATLTGISDSQLTVRVGGRTSRLDLYAGVEKLVTSPAQIAATEAVRPGAAN